MFTVDVHTTCHILRSSFTGTYAGKNPNFNQTLKFTVGHQPYILELEVWDDDPGKDDFMAKGM